MYVCLCEGVTDGQIREAIYEGCCSYRDVRATLGVASQFCGSLIECIKKPDFTSGFFMPVIQWVTAKMQNLSALISINFNFEFKHLGLTVENHRPRIWG